tara:strand:+ start:65 stop:265 length:201 start_codon:yes stop_codon:yes gene_type:complete
MADGIMQNILANDPKGRTYEAIETFISESDRQKQVQYILERFEKKRAHVEIYQENGKFMLKYTIEY